MIIYLHIFLKEVKSRLGKPLISFINLKKVYDNGFEAVKHFDLNIAKGEFVTLLGPSGCGKTTVLRMLAGFEFPTHGKILYNGIDIKNTPINSRPSTTVFQDYALFPNMTVRQNIEYGLKAMRVQSENITDEILKKADVLFADYKKKSVQKIKSLEKHKITLEKDILKCNNEYARKKGWLEIKKMRQQEFNKHITKLQHELYKIHGESFTSKQTLNNQFRIKLNMMLLKLHLSYRLDVTTKGMNDIEKNIHSLTKIYSAKCLLDKKYDELKSKYNDLDFEISFWQNYPILQKEKYIKNHGSRKLNKLEIVERTNKVIELVGLNGKETLMPNELSGGMQQRVALARAIVIEPEIVLLDEPLSALDAKVRAQMQKELKRLHDELKITFILVTHDQEEALSLSNKVVVMSEGKIEQIGTPTQVYDSPINKWVATFIGRANIFNGTFITNDNVIFLNKSHQVDSIFKFKENTKINVMIRPEDFDVVPAGKGFIDVKVVSIVYKGLLWDIKCQFENQIIYVEGIHKAEINSTIGLLWDIEDVHLIKVR